MDKLCFGCGKTFTCQFSCNCDMKKDDEDCYCPQCYTRRLRRGSITPTIPRSVCDVLSQKEKDRIIITLMLRRLKLE